MNGPNPNAVRAPKRGRIGTSSVMMSSPPHGGMYCDYSMIQTDQYSGQMMQPVAQFHQPASFMAALVTNTQQMGVVQMDNNPQMMYSQQYVESPDSYRFNDGGQGGASFPPESVPQFSVSADALYAFGVEDPSDQLSIAKLLELGCIISSGNNLRKSLGTMVQYMKTFTESSKAISDARDVLEEEKRMMTVQLAAKEMEIVALGNAKDQEYQPRIEAMETELRQNGLDKEQLRSAHSRDIEKILFDYNSASSEMDRVQRMCDEKDNELASLRARIDGVQATAAELQAVKDRVARLELENASLKQQNEALQSSATELQSLKDRVASLDVENRLLTEARALSAGLVDGVNSLRESGKFHDNVEHGDVICPVMCTSGEVVSMKHVVSAWVDTPGGSDVNRSFRCSPTGKDTAIVSRPIFESVQEIAAAIGVNMEPPCVFEYGVGTTKVRLPVYDVLALVSRISKIHRDGDVEEGEMLALKGGVVVMFNLTTAGDSQRKRLGFSVHKMGGGPSSQYTGYFRVTESDWSPFESLDFVAE